MKRISVGLAAVVIASTVALAGCLLPNSAGDKFGLAEQGYSQVKSGMSKSDVKAKMGDPDEIKTDGIWSPETWVYYHKTEKANDGSPAYRFYVQFNGQGVVTSMRDSGN